MIMQTKLRATRRFPATRRIPATTGKSTTASRGFPTAGWLPEPTSRRVPE